MRLPGNEKIRLLLVDDEDGFRMTISKRLAKRGFIPIQASSGEACLKILGDQGVDVIVLDVKMPGISGIETLKEIKKTNEKIQVILLTGNSAIADGIEGIKSGAFDYLTKPVEIDHLVNKINQAFELIVLEQEKQDELAYREKLEKKIIDAERLMSLGTLATGIAHEINNPLAIINESAGFMKQVITEPEKITLSYTDALLMGIEKIEKSVQRARRITHQLLGHVKKQDSRFYQVNLNTLLHETLNLLKRELEEKNIKITWKVDSEKTIFWSDPYQIRQILMNLLNNAIHAVEINGSIVLSISETEDTVILEIRDNGVGIPEENLGKIFDPFFTTKSFDEGTGLGLFVVYKLLSDLNGQIDVESRIGKGTIMKIVLPRGLK